MARGGSGLGRLRQRWRSWLAGAGGILAIGTATGLEVQDRRAEEGPPPLAVGARAALGPYAVTLAGIERHAAYPDGAPGPDVLWLRARVENLTARTRNDIGDYIRLGGEDAPPIPMAGDAGFYLMRDAALQAQLQPALPEDVVLAFPADAGAGAVKVTLFRTGYKRRDALSGSAGWFDPEPQGTAVLPVPAGVAP